MKFSKQQRVLAGVTRVRIHLRMTQESFALYIGVSKSLISRVENGKRQLPVKALHKICDLEKDWHFIVEAEAATLQKKEAATAKTLDKLQQIQLYRRQLRLQELQYEYKKMTERYGQVTTASGLVKGLLNRCGHEAGSRERTILEFQLFKLDQQLKSCCYATRVNKQNQIALLEQLLNGEQVNEQKTMSDIGMLRRPLLPQIAA